MFRPFMLRLHDDNTISKSNTSSAPEPDWSREAITGFWQPGQKLLRSIRRYQAAKARGAWLTRKYWVLVHRFWSTVSHCEIHLNCQIGGGLLLPHPNGIVVHPDARLGVNCLLFQQVTLAGPVELGDHVDLGAGAKIIGPLFIGNSVTVGANTVVTQDLPSNVTAVGMPARIVSRSTDVPDDLPQTQTTNARAVRHA